MKDKKKLGVIVGRFQVAYLTEAHKKLIKRVQKINDKVLIFVGVSTLKVTKTNPLSYETVKGAILDYCHFSKIKVNVHHIQDCYSDKVWSDKLDNYIKTFQENKKVTLYGGRDSFIPYYTGIYKTVVLNINKSDSGTQQREEIKTRKIINSMERKGVIWATQNQYINTTPCVDIAILKEDTTLGFFRGLHILLGQKINEPLVRFPGGHVGVNETFEQAAIKETKEETNINIEKMDYLGSAVISDWRHKKGDTSITTAFFKTYVRKETMGIAGDDLKHVYWFEYKDIRNNYKKLMMPAHHKLMKLLINNLEGE